MKRYLKYETDASKEIFVDTSEAADLLGVCYQSARDYMRRLREELKMNGVICLHGKIPREFFMRRFGLHADLTQVPVIVVPENIKEKKCEEVGQNEKS